MHYTERKSTTKENCFSKNRKQLPYSLDLTGMPAYFSNPLWGARVIESARVLESVRLISKNRSGRTLPTDSSLRRVPVKSRVPVYSKVPVYFSIPVRGARVFERARQIERVWYSESATNLKFHSERFHLRAPQVPTWIAGSCASRNDYEFPGSPNVEIAEAELAIAKTV